MITNKQIIDCKISFLFIISQATKGVVATPPPYVFMRKNFFHMEYNFCNLGSCSRFIGAHFEVNNMVVAHAIQKLYPIYPRHQGGGGYHPPSFSTVAY